MMFHAFYETKSRSFSTNSFTTDLLHALSVKPLTIRLKLTIGKKIM